MAKKQASNPPAPPPPPPADALLATAASRAAAAARRVEWIDRLAPEHRDAIVEVRDRWREVGRAGGIPARYMADVIVEHYGPLGCKLPSADRITRWLSGK